MTEPTQDVPPPPSPPPSPAEDARTRSSALLAGRRILLTEGPDAISCAAVARAVGCDESDVTRLFVSDAALAEAVGQHLVAALGGLTDAVAGKGPESFVTLLDTLFAEPDLRRVFVRSVVEDRDVVMTVTHDNPVNALVRWVERERGRRRGRVPARTRVCVFASVSLLFGWLSGAEQLIEGLGLHVFSETERNAAIAAAAGSLAHAALSDEPELRPTAPRFRPPTSLPDELLPVDDAMHAVLAEAIRPDSFDVAAVVTLLRRHSAVPGDVVGQLARGEQIGDVRREFPVLQGLVASLGGVPAGPPRSGLDDPRLAAAAAAALVQGAIVGDRKLRGLTGLTGSVNVEPALTVFAEMLLAGARSAPGSDDARP